jgi:hypothetical protein
MRIGLNTVFSRAEGGERFFSQEQYLAEITQSVGGSIPNPLGFGDVSVFLTRAYDKDHFRCRLLEKQRVLIPARTNRKINSDTIKHTISIKEIPVIE